MPAQRFRGRPTSLGFVFVPSAQGVGSQAGLGDWEASVFPTDSISSLALNS